jgi:hypothetical protein
MLTLLAPASIRSRERIYLVNYLTHHIGPPSGMADKKMGVREVADPRHTWHQTNIVSTLCSETGPPWVTAHGRACYTVCPTTQRAAKEWVL